MWIRYLCVLYRCLLWYEILVKFYSIDATESFFCVLPKAVRVTDGQQMIVLSSAKVSFAFSSMFKKFLCQFVKEFSRKSLCLQGFPKNLLRIFNEFEYFLCSSAPATVTFFDVTIGKSTFPLRSIRIEYSDQVKSG